MGVEEPGCRRIHLFFDGGDLLDIAHPSGIGCGPKHELEPVQDLECKEENEGDTKIWVQGAGELSPTEDGRDPVEQRRGIKREAGEEGEEEKERDRPRQEARLQGKAK